MISLEEGMLLSEIPETSNRFGFDHFQMGGKTGGSTSWPNSGLGPEVQNLSLRPWFLSLSSISYSALADSLSAFYRLS